MPSPRMSLFSTFRHASNALCTTSASTKSVPARIGTLSALNRPQPSSTKPSQPRTFSTTSSSLNWLIPNRELKFKEPKGRPRMNTGGSTRGTTIEWGDYGLRLKDHDRRISAAQLRNGEDVIRRRLRGQNYRLFMRWHAGTAVYTKGNESRMGTGKGSFDYWAARVPVSRIIFEVKADVHEQVIRDAMRLAANKMPGTYEFVKKGDPPMMGITKLRTPTAEAELRRPRKKIAAPSMDSTANRLPGAPT